MLFLFMFSQRSAFEFKNLRHFSTLFLIFYKTAPNDIVLAKNISLQFIGSQITVSLNVGSAGFFLIFHVFES